jgi:hypothetical protein
MRLAFRLGFGLNLLQYALLLDAQLRLIAESSRKSTLRI